MRTTMILVSALLTAAPLPAQEVDDATKAWALKRAYQLNGDSMVGCRLRADAEWSCHSVDLSGEIISAQSGPKPEPAPIPKNDKR